MGITKDQITDNVGLCRSCFEQWSDLPASAGLTCKGSGWLWEASTSKGMDG